MKYLLQAGCFISICLFIICCGPKTLNSKYHKYYEENLDACVKVLMENQIDSLVALKRCSCYLDNLYKIDSTFIDKKENEVNDFIKANRSKIQMICDSIK